MKKNVLLLMASTLVCLVACNKETELPNDEPTGQGNDVITEVVGAGLDKNETKADISDGLKFSWRNGSDRAGDYVAFWNGSTFVRSAASSAAAASTTFEITYSGTRSEYAYYPYYIVQNIATEVNETGKLAAAGTTTVVLPDTYDYAEVSGTNTPCPMIAANTAGAGWAFKQLCGLLRLTVPGIPTKANELVITFDKVVTGAFNVTGADTDTPYISAKDGTSSVTITLTPGANYCGAVVNIPVPQGTISVTKVETKVGETLLATSITPTILSSWTVARKHGKKATAAFTPSIASMIISPGKLYTDSDGNLLMADNWYTHMHVLSGGDENKDDIADDKDTYVPNGNGVNSFETEAKYSALNRTHFNWNEMYHLFHGKTPAELTWALATNNRIEGLVDDDISYPMSKSNFGDGYTWRIPTQEEFYRMIFYSSTQRRGGKLNGTLMRYIKLLVTDMPENTGTSVLKDPGTESESISGQPKLKLSPSQTYQAGVLFIPDNIEIVGDYFTTLDTKSYSDLKTPLYKSKITKTNLDILIAKGCAFFPALGHWTPWTFDKIIDEETIKVPYRFNAVGSTGYYWSDTQGHSGMAPDNRDAAKYLYIGSDTLSASIDNSAAVNRKGDFMSVRLVRDVE